MRTSAAATGRGGRRLGDSGTAARNRLVLRHVGLVRGIAHRLARRLPPQVELSDLIGVGLIGLIEAAQRYRPSMGVPFDAFARRRLQGAMLDALRNLDWAPRSLRKMRRDVDGAIGQLRHELARDPRAPEVAAAMDFSVDKYAHVVEQLRTLEVGAIRQLDTAAPDGTPLMELCIDPGEGPESSLARRELRALLCDAVLELPERERRVLALYYEEDLTMAEIGEALGVSESRVSQLRSQALSRLRTCLRRSLGLPETQAPAPVGHQRIGQFYGSALEPSPATLPAWRSRVAAPTAQARPRLRAAGRVLVRRRAGLAFPGAVAADAPGRTAMVPNVFEQAVA